MTAPTVTITLGPWQTMVRELFAWVVGMHISLNRAALTIRIPRTTVNTWVAHGVPLGVRGAKRRTPGYSWDADAEALMGPGFAMVTRDGAGLVIENEEGDRVTIEISAVLEVLERDPPRPSMGGRVK
jgi:hypothetical protein